MTSFPATDAIIDYIIGYDLDKERSQEVSGGKWLIADLLGVAFAGACSGLGRTDAVASLVGVPDGEATIIGTSLRARAADAALVNGYSGHLLEYDDATLNPVGHPSVTILPTVLALAEARRLDGRDVLQAYLAGLEVHARLGQAQSANWSYRNPWLPIGNIGIIGAAAAAARLLSFDRQTTADCLGLASHFACELNISNGSLAKSLGAGHAARCAVDAAQLAELGVTGAQGVFERPGGFAETFLTAGPDELEEVVGRLGRPSHLQEIGIAIKRYPTCYGTHWGIDALRHILEEHSLLLDDVRSVGLVYPEGAAFLDDPEPTTTEEARFSYQYALAACLLDGYPRLESFQECRLGDAKMVAALKLIDSQPHSAGTAAPECWLHRVTVRTLAGEKYVHTVQRPRGHPRDPLKEREIEDKFVVNTSVLGADRSRSLIGKILCLEQCRDVRRLMDSLAYASGTPR